MCLCVCGRACGCEESSDFFLKKSRLCYLSVWCQMKCSNSRHCPDTAKYNCYWSTHKWTVFLNTTTPVSTNTRHPPQHRHTHTLTLEPYRKSVFISVCVCAHVCVRERKEESLTGLRILWMSERKEQNKSLQPKWKWRATKAESKSACLKFWTSIKPVWEKKKTITAPI